MFSSSHLAALFQLAVFPVALSMASTVYQSSIITDSSSWTVANLDGLTYINKGLVGVGEIASNTKDSHGDTVGGWGSAIAIKRGTWRENFDGSFTGVLVGQPDRGFNIDGTVDFQSRRYEFEFTFRPYFGLKSLSLSDALRTFEFSLIDTVYYSDKFLIPTTGLDALSVRPQQQDFPFLTGSYPELPIPSLAFNHISLDVEGLVLMPDGSVWISDEYGPYAYQVSAEGIILNVALPSNASIPFLNGVVNFTSVVNPTCGRQANTGFEGLSASPDSANLYAFVQAALMQDGGSKKSTSRFTRLYAWKLNSVAPHPTLFEEYVVALPNPIDGKTKQSSELHYINNVTFLTLDRDGNGWGNGNDTEDLSIYKQINLFSTKGATNILGSKFDQCVDPVAPGGVLDPSVTAAPVVSFINMLDGFQLSRLGMNNGSTGPTGIIDKFESIAIAPANIVGHPNDYFLFTCCDNDFQTTDGSLKGNSFNATIDIPNRCLIYLATLPGIVPGSVPNSLSI